MISILHPSKGRPGKAFDTVENWIRSAGVPVQYILSLDLDDPALKEYMGSFYYLNHFHKDWTCIINNNGCVVKAVNKAAEQSSGDILIYLSDDFDCFPGWGELIERAAYPYGDDPWILKVDDGHQKFLAPVLTIPIMSRALYIRLGYFFNPIYRNMYVDNDLFQVCSRMNVIKKHKELKFVHQHPDANKNISWDETYESNSSNAAHNYGRMIFEERVKNRFE